MNFKMQIENMIISTCHGLKNQLTGLIYMAGDNIPVTMFAIKGQKEIRKTRPVPIQSVIINCLRVLLCFIYKIENATRRISCEKKKRNTLIP